MKPNRTMQCISVKCKDKREERLALSAIMEMLDQLIHPQTKGEKNHESK